MQEIKSILLVVNPISGNINKSELIEEIKLASRKFGAKLDIYKTDGESDIINLRALLKADEPDRVIVAGGDGTIKIVAEALQHHEIPLGIIPAGSANALAVNLHIPHLLNDQLKVALGGCSREVDLLSINGELCLHMSDLGLNAELIKNYESSPIRGKMGYLLQTIPTLMRSKYPFEFTIETENKSYTRKGILLAFANAKKYGTGANVNPRGKIDDGIFEVLIFKNFDIFEIIKTLRNEAELDPDFMETIPAKEVSVTCTDPVPFQIDGEYIGEKKNIDARISDKKLKIMVPQKPELAPEKNAD
ncbi:MAG: YegS/Rv2252/BmrU family lipid kinase [Salegentibacter sp.]